MTIRDFMLIREQLYAIEKDAIKKKKRTWPW